MTENELAMDMILDDEPKCVAEGCGQEMGEHAYLMHEYQLVCPLCRATGPVRHVLQEAERQAARIEALEAIARVIAEQECHCDEAYTARGRHEANAWHSDFEDVIADAQAYFAAAKEAQP